MLDDHYAAPLPRERPYDARDGGALVRVVVRRRLVEKVQVGVARGRGRDGHALQLAAGQLGDLAARRAAQAQLADKPAAGAPLVVL